LKATIRGIECEGTPEELAAFERAQDLCPVRIVQPVIEPIPMMPICPVDPWNPWYPPQVTWSSNAFTVGGEA
jgi:hypothetical protein